MWLRKNSHTELLAPHSVRRYGRPLSALGESLTENLFAEKINLPESAPAFVLELYRWNHRFRHNPMQMTARRVNF
jgi:hypothetical protein